MMLLEFALITKNHYYIFKTQRLVLHRLYKEFTSFFAVHDPSRVNLKIVYLLKFINKNVKKIGKNK